MTVVLHCAAIVAPRAGAALLVHPVMIIAVNAAVVTVKCRAHIL
jgi:hypothetical protein